jgi:hypothetical protein
MCAKSRGLGPAGPGPSREWRLWLGPALEKAKAASGQAKAAAFGPSRAGTSLVKILVLFPQGCYLSEWLDKGHGNCNFSLTTGYDDVFACLHSVGENKKESSKVRSRTSIDEDTIKLSLALPVQRIAP